MLDLIKNWIAAIAIAVLLGAILETLLPQGSIKKYARTAIAVTIMLVIVTPVIGMLNGRSNIQNELEGIFAQTEEPSLQIKNNTSLYKDYVYEVYMRAKKNKNE